MRTTLYLLLFYLNSLSVSSQNTTVYEGGEVFAVQWTGKQISSKIPAGFSGKVLYNRLSNSYTVTWTRKDGNELRMNFTWIGKIDNENLFQEEAGRQYVIDTSNLSLEGMFFALQVDLNNHTVGNKGLLVTRLKRK